LFQKNWYVANLSLQNNIF